MKKSAPNERHFRNQPLTGAAKETGEKLAIAIGNALVGFAPVSASLGVACFGQVAESFSEMLAAADKLMYRVKHEGRDGILVQSFGLPDAGKSP